ncbi:hypothetical protein SVAN01_07104 [Stagonosporopsis vannaccii]|nr:hypothetical protein SVAN01_07104 [Stagonosporopsis vannaccii]
MPCFPRYEPDLRNRQTLLRFESSEPWLKHVFRSELEGVEDEGQKAGFIVNLAAGAEESEVVLLGSGVFHSDAPGDPDFAVYGDYGFAEHKCPNYVAQLCWEEK